MNLHTIEQTVLWGMRIALLLEITLTGIILYRLATRKHRITNTALLLLAGIALLITTPNAIHQDHQLQINVPDYHEARTLINTLANTNPSLLTGLNEIRTAQPLDSPTIACNIEQKCIGSYSPLTKTIYIKKNQMTEEVIQHELQHHIWYNQLTEEERTTWNTIYMTTNATTDYGRTSPEEDFAETGMIYNTNPQTLIEQNQITKLQYFNKIYTRIISQHKTTNADDKHEDQTHN